LLMLTGIGHQL